MRDLDSPVHSVSVSVRTSYFSVTLVGVAPHGELKVSLFSLFQMSWRRLATPVSLLVHSGIREGRMLLCENV